MSSEWSTTTVPAKCTSLTGRAFRSTWRRPSVSPPVSQLSCTWECCNAANTDIRFRVRNPAEQAWYHAHRQLRWSDTDLGRTGGNRTGRGGCTTGRCGRGHRGIGGSICFRYWVDRTGGDTQCWLHAHDESIPTLGPDYRYQNRSGAYGWCFRSERLGWYRRHCHLHNRHCGSQTGPTGTVRVPNHRYVWCC